MQKTKKFRRLLAGGVAVLMLGVSVPVAAFATDDGTNPAVVTTSTTVVQNFQFVDENGNVVGGGDLIVEQGNNNYSVVAESDIVPAGYEVTSMGDFYADGKNSVTVNVKLIVTTVVQNFQFVDENGNVVGGGDLIVEQGNNNYSVVAESDIVPAGYEVTSLGDFYADGENSVTVNVKKITTDVTMNIQFKDGDQVIAGGDYFVPAGVQNYSVLEKYVPVGYRMTVSGDFMAEEGAHLDVNVEKISTDVIMNIRFMDGETFVAGGDYFVPEGVQNYTVLNQYMPEGYEMDVAGDFMAKAGASMEVPVHKVVAENPTTGSTGNTGNSSSSSSNTTTVSSDSSDSDVVKASTPADNSAKIIPQTGLSIESPVLLGVMMVSALVAAAAYLFVIRKQLN